MGPSSTSQSSYHAANSRLPPLWLDAVPISTPEILPRDSPLPVQVSHLEGVVAVFDGHLQFLARAAIRLDPTLTVRGPYPDLDPGPLYRLGVAVADTAAGHLPTDPDPGRGRLPLEVVGAGEAVGDETTAMIEGGAPAVEVTTATTVAAGVEVASGAGDDGRLQTTLRSGTGLGFTEFRHGWG
jgi:hypothetical protein